MKTSIQHRRYCECIEQFIRKLIKVKFFLKFTLKKCFDRSYIGVYINTQKISLFFFHFKLILRFDLLTGYKLMKTNIRNRQ